jgi:hypothetical protein
VRHPKGWHSGSFGIFNQSLTIDLSAKSKKISKVMSCGEQKYFGTLLTLLL